MRRHLLFWFVLMIIGVLNGILRVATYGSLVTDLLAHQLSTVTGIGFTGLATWFLWKRNPLHSVRRTWLVGIVWFLLTILFEFGFGHYIVGHPWQLLIADYNLFEGRLWALFLGWILVMPYVFFRYFRSKDRPGSRRKMK